MIAVLDTNILMKDWRLSGLHFRLLFECAPLHDVTLAIPEVVIDELVGNYDRRYRKLCESVTKAQSGLRQLTGEQVAFDLQAADTAKQAYRSWFNSKIVEQSIVRLLYPDVSHAEVVKRIYESRRPFQGDERGYKDFLIWWSCVAAIKTYGKCVLVTENARDFADSGKLHYDLQREARSHHGEVLLASSLIEFLRSHVFPRLEPDKGLEMSLRAGELRGYDPTTWIKAFLNEPTRLLSDFEWELPCSIHSIDWAECGEVENVNVVQALELGKDGALVEAEADVYINFAGSVTDSDHSGVDYEIERDLGTAFAVGSISTTLGFELRVSTTDGRILDGSASWAHLEVS
ncbi:MAG: PIN domain-containing protein [Gammaproteobacteria bacterium]